VTSVGRSLRRGAPPISRIARVALALLIVLAASCGGGGSDDASAGGGGGGSPTLADFPTTRLDVGGVAFAVWLAESDAQHRRGFMFVTADEIAPLADGTPRGMLFLFASDRRLSFYMRDTQVPLDLAYATADGTIVEVHELVPFEETSVVASRPVRYALEAIRGTFERHGIGVGDRIAIPAR
jgi:uncharacterized membrane protein (UPF0127 family)